MSTRQRLGLGWMLLMIASILFEERPFHELPQFEIVVFCVLFAIGALALITPEDFLR